MAYRLLLSSLLTIATISAACFDSTDDQNPDAGRDGGTGTMSGAPEGVVGLLAPDDCTRLCQWTFDTLGGPTYFEGCDYPFATVPDCAAFCFSGCCQAITSEWEACAHDMAAGGVECSILAPVESCLPFQNCVFACP